MKPIIIADDEDSMRTTFARFIRRYSKTEVDEVGDGVDLVERVRQGDYSLVFTDNDMPSMSGLTAIIKIREFNKSIPICMVSGDKADKVRPEAMGVGATDYIDKGDEDSVGHLKRTVEKYAD